MYRSPRMKPVERRRELRHRVLVSGGAPSQAGDDPTECVLLDLSIYGCRLQSSADYAPGDSLRLRLAGWPAVDGEVVWIRDGLIACRFDDPISREMLRSLTLRAA